MNDAPPRADLSLDDVAAEIYASLDPAATVAAITQSSLRALGADRATTYVADAAGLVHEVHTTESDERLRAFIEQSVGRPLTRMPVWVSLTAADDPVMLVDDVALHPGLGPEFARRIGATAFAGVRLEGRGLVGDEVEFLGAIFCSFRDRRVFTDRERSAVRTLGALASLALANARLFAATHRGLRDAQARAEAERVYRLLADNASDVITRCDARGTISYISPASLQVLGIGAPEAIGRSLPDLLGLDDPAALTAGAAVITRLPRDGAEVWVETMARQVGDPLSGDPVEIHAATRDVTARQRARDELSAVAAEQAALRHVASALAAGAGESDVWSDLARELGVLVGATGASVLRAGSEGATIVGTWAIDGAPAAGRALTPAELGPVGAVLGSGRGADGRLVTGDSPLGADGAFFAAEPFGLDGTPWGAICVTGGPWVTGARALNHLHAFAQAAVTSLGTLLARADRDQLEGELRHAQKLEAVGQLAAGIAHEINTPIQYVGDSVEFLRDGFDDLRGLLERYRALAETAATGSVEDVASRLADADAEADLEYLLEQMPKAIERTLDGAGRVAEIVRAMKEFAHPRRESQAPADLNRAIRSTATVAINELKYVADVVFDLSDVPPVTCHLGDVNQVVLNLMVNAAHAIAERAGAGGPERGTITVSTRVSGDRRVTISVADTGSGIPDEVRERVFEPFFTTKEVGKGTGQGLAIAARVCEAHGGSLTFDTTVGEGTTFHIRLPVDGAGAPMEVLA